MTWWGERADALRDHVRERERDFPTHYEEAVVNESIVHTREDIVLIFSMLESVNEQLRHTRGLLLIIMVLVALGLWRVW